MTPSFSLAFWHFKRNALISRKCYYLFKLIIKEKKRGSFRTQCCNSILKSNLGFNVCTFWIYIFIKQGGRLRNIFIKKYAFQWLLRWLRQGRICPQCGILRFDPWVRKIPWRREWLPTPIFLPGKSHGQRDLAGYNPWDGKELDTTEQLTLSLSLFQSSSLTPSLEFRLELH